MVMTAHSPNSIEELRLVRIHSNIVSPVSLVLPEHVSPVWQPVQPMGQLYEAREDSLDTHHLSRLMSEAQLWFENQKGDKTESGLAS